MDLRFNGRDTLTYREAWEREYPLGFGSSNLISPVRDEESLTCHVNDMAEWTPLTIHDLDLESENLFDVDSILNSPPGNSRSLLKPLQDRVPNVYGLKAESQDAILPAIADSDDEFEVLKPFQSSSSSTCPVEQIKMVLDDEDCVDIETVGDAPIIQAPDLDSLMDQFEASSRLNVAYEVAKESPRAVYHPLPTLTRTKKRDAPQEEVEKLEASRKVIHVIPSIPSKPLQTGTRMQDAGAKLNRNKLLKIVSSGDSVQLDHDYCSSIGDTPPPQIRFLHIDSVEYKGCALPIQSPPETVHEIRDLNVVEKWDKNSKKDSGLESGEVSDTSEEAAPPLKAAEEAPRVKKSLSLEEYRKRRQKEAEQKASSASSSSASSCLSSPTNPLSPVQAAEKPEMHSVEVQTQESEISTLEAKTRDHSKAERSSRSAHKNRQYRTHNSDFRDRSPSVTSSSSKSNSSYRRSGHKSRRKPSRSSSSSSDRSSYSRSRSIVSSTKRRRHSSSYRRESSWYSSRSSPNRSNSPFSTASSYTSNSSSEIYLTEKDREQHVEQRKVVYVGGLSDAITKAELRERFESFGKIIDISIHLREHKENYGFVTYEFSDQAFAAVKYGNKGKFPQYDLSFGGRRLFCRERYSDLDAQGNRSGGGTQRPKDSFDDLMRQAQANLKKRVDQSTKRKREKFL